MLDTESQVPDGAEGQGFHMPEETPNRSAIEARLAQILAQEIPPTRDELANFDLADLEKLAREVEAGKPKGHVDNNWTTKFDHIWGAVLAQRQGRISTQPAVTLEPTPLAEAAVSAPVVENEPAPTPVEIPEDRSAIEDQLAHLRDQVEPPAMAELDGFSLGDLEQLAREVEANKPKGQVDNNWTTKFDHIWGAVLARREGRLPSERRPDVSAPISTTTSEPEIAAVVSPEMPAVAPMVETDRPVVPTPEVPVVASAAEPVPSVEVATPVEQPDEEEPVYAFDGTDAERLTFIEQLADREPTFSDMKRLSAADLGQLFDRIIAKHGNQDVSQIHKLDAIQREVVRRAQGAPEPVESAETIVPSVEVAEVPTAVPVAGEKTYGDTDVVPGMEKYAAQLSGREARIAESFQTGRNAQPVRPRNEGPAPEVTAPIADTVPEASRPIPTAYEAALRRIAANAETTPPAAAAEAPTTPEPVVAPSSTTERYDGIDPFSIHGVMARGERAAETPEPIVAETPVTPAPEVVPPVETPPEIPEAPVAPETEPHEPTAVDDARQAYAKALRAKSKLFGRTSEADLAAAASTYHEALRLEGQGKLDALKVEMTGADLTSPEVQANMNAKLAEFVISQHQEENALREAMRDVGEKSGFDKLKAAWRKHAKLRLAVSAGLMGASIAAGATGNIPLAIGLQAARTALSSTGAYMGTEAAWEMSRDRFGATRKMSETQVEQISDRELERRMAAHTMLHVDRHDAEFGKRTGRTLLLKPKVDATGDRLMQEYERRQLATQTGRIEQLKHQGESPDAIFATVIAESMDGLTKLHDAYATRRDADRQNAIKKHLTAGVAGLIAGAFGLGRLEHLAQHHDTASQAASAAKNGVHRPTIIAAGKPGGIDTHVAPADQTSTPGSMIEQHGAGPEVAPKVEMIETVKKGDNVWSISRRHLTEQFGKKFTGLDQARQTFIIDSVKDKIAAHPEAFGLQHGVDHLDVGQKLDLAPIFDQQHVSNLDTTFASAQKLSKTAVEHILSHDKQIAAWAHAHPDQPLTADRIDTILHGGKSAAKRAVANVAGASEPTTPRAVNLRLEQQLNTSIKEKWLSHMAQEKPEWYARMHAEHPDQYPAVAGIQETTLSTAPNLETALSVTEHVELPAKGVKALKKFHEVIDGVAKDTGKSSADDMMKMIGKMKVTEVAKKGMIEAAVDRHEGGTADVAEAVEKHMHKVLDTFPEDQITKATTIDDVLARVETRP